MTAAAMQMADMTVARICCVPADASSIREFAA
mgnify:CR=1 FL=1